MVLNIEHSGCLNHNFTLDTNENLTEVKPGTDGLIAQPNNNDMVRTLESVNTTMRDVKMRDKSAACLRNETHLRPKLLVEGR